MAHHVVVWNDGEEDSIISYTKSPAVVVVFERQDLLNVFHIEQAKIPGIYILLGDNNHIYIGQAAHDITSRIKRHDKNKAFWNRCILFGREDKQLDKSQLDYLEKVLIERFYQSGYQLDNSTEGNSSVIFPYQKGIAQSLLVEVEEILQRFTKYTIKPVRQSHSDHIDVKRPVEKTTTTIKDDHGVIIEANSTRQAYINYIKELCIGSECYSVLIEEAQKDSTWIISIETWNALPDKTKRYYKKINEQIMLNVNYSKASIASNIRKLENILKRSITISYD